MTKKNIFLIGLLVAFAGVYVVFFSGWFGTKPIQIMHNVHAPRGGRRRGDNSPERPVVAFGFDREYLLTDVKVVSVSAFKTNASPLPLWHMVSETNSVPVKTIIYGQWIQGMKPAVANLRARPLQPGESYKLFVKTANQEKGEYEFQAPAMPK